MSGLNRLFKSEHSKEGSFLATESYWLYVGGAKKMADAARRRFSTDVFVRRG